MQDLFEIYFDIGTNNYFNAIQNNVRHYASLSLSLLKRCTRAKSIYVLENECRRGQLICTHTHRDQSTAEKGRRELGTLYFIVFSHNFFVMMDATDVKNPDIGFLFRFVRLVGMTFG